MALVTVPRTSSHGAVPKDQLQRLVMPPPSASVFQEQLDICFLRSNLRSTYFWKSKYFIKNAKHPFSCSWARLAAWHTLRFILFGIWFGLFGIFICRFMCALLLAFRSQGRGLNVLFPKSRSHGWLCHPPVPPYSKNKLKLSPKWKRHSFFKSIVFNHIQMYYVPISKPVGPA